MPVRNDRTGGTRSVQEAWPRWMYVAVPALVVFVVVGLWWALFSPPAEQTAQATVTATRPVGVIEQPTQGPTEQATLDAFAPTATTVLPTLPPTTPGAGEGAPQVDLAATETAVAQQAEANTPRTPLAINDRAAVCCTDMAGLRLRAEAGTEHPVVKLLEEGKIVEIIGGPKEASGFTWWQVQDEVGTSGWAAEDFMLKQE
ncbi:MAG: SH3 domain-containing protein [Anaerolineae bacterium]|jgi:hypothetical protein|nr:SH3 domain-containing protein [Chloroflexota bacterium]